MSTRRSISMVLVWLCALAGGLLLWSAPALAQRMHAFSTSFGSEGSGDGQFLRPGAVAVNEATGDVYVIDRGNSRVEIFSSTGAYVGQFNGSASPTGVFSWPSAAMEENDSGEGWIAVDNSTNPSDPSRGDVYVVDEGRGHNVIDKFSASGAYIGQVVGTPTQRFNSDGEEGTVGGIVLDANGDLWVEYDYSLVAEFNDQAPVNEYVTSIEPQTTVKEGEINKLKEGLHAGLAVDSEGNLYVGQALNGIFSDFAFTGEFSETGEDLFKELDEEQTTGLAVDLSSDDVYLDHESSIAAYGPTHLPIERFGSGQLQQSEGVAVDSATGTVFASSVGSQSVAVFSAFVVPDVSTGLASDFAETSVTVGGVVNPDGLAVTSCVFEYGTSEAYGQSAPCSPAPGSGSSPEAVSAHLEGLQPLTEYHFRLKVANANGANVGQDRKFLTPRPVVLSEEAVSDVASSSALFSVQVDPGGADTTYEFEYGPSAAYGSSVPVPAGDAGSEAGSVPEAVRVEGLLGETTYHMRVVASNVLGTVYGPDQTFTTQAAGGAFMLPDGREWELVSPPDKEGALIEAIGSPLGDAGLIDASVDGSAISYWAHSPVGSGQLSNAAPFGVTQVLSRRGADGWSSQDVTTPEKTEGEEVGPGEYLFFSSDLSQAIVDPTGNITHELLSPEATEPTPYVRDNLTGSYVPLVSASDVLPGVKFNPSGTANELHAIAATPDLSHVIIPSHFALTSGAVEGEGEDLYEWSGGRLQLVANQASLGSDGGNDTRNALSSDGSRVFVQGSEGALYMRDTVTGKTLHVDAPAPGVPAPGVSGAGFEIASVDGSKVFFVDAEPLTADSKLKPGAGAKDLYVCEIVEAAGEPSCDLTDLSVDPNAGEAAAVQDEVLGASEDGSIVYFVARGRLAEGAQAGGENLYVESETGASWSAPRLVAVLGEEESYDWAGQTPGKFSLGQLEYLTSRVSANGRYLTFMSDRNLTGYDSRDAVSGQPDMEVFLYDEAAGRLGCVSCDPTGARPVGIIDEGRERSRLLVDRDGLWEGSRLAASIPGWTAAEPYTAYRSRVLSDEGRMFFDSTDALVPQATNGKEDVYEYEPAGVGGASGCTTATATYVANKGGCVSLISAGTSGEESAFLDASETGSDVFFLTAARLTRSDLDSSFDVYDAHACSSGSPCVSAPVAPPPCSSGDACKAAPSPQPPIFGAPSSATFSGAGNVTPEPPPVAVKTTKRKSKGVKCPRGKRLSRGRCVKVKKNTKTAKVKRADRKGRR